MKPVKERLIRAVIILGVYALFITILLYFGYSGNNSVLNKVILILVIGLAVWALFLVYREITGYKPKQFSKVYKQMDIWEKRLTSRNDFMRRQDEDIREMYDALCKRVSENNISIQSYIDVCDFNDRNNIQSIQNKVQRICNENDELLSKYNDLLCQLVELDNSAKGRTDISEIDYLIDSLQEMLKEDSK